ncbi:cobyric acid synthase cobq, putative [Heliomicrobium modesticaldum Ice1]|uniref:Lipid II isoglutaminyl synthase (glutamine-hydrolyzing) subunit GatD n=1 Tax=Heliobacterium modesticaldum (strain ATCC 51547 / Ice1) TaxID=498761 RepID=B0TBK6_HELMI|nr:glutamine amidotransferase [Heliomicrobium modesticaldum]ABZ83845.1 cobyric acid synthase cobq, putative [Heliomicrobium modesticaldum Ice1]
MVRTDRRALRLVHLYPDLLNLYGDRGNIITLLRRCEWRGIPLAVERVSLNDRFAFTDADLVFMGGGSDREQTLLFRDFQEHKGPALVEAAESGLPLLSVCGGYQLLGRYYRTHTGAEMPGLGLFDAWTTAGSTRLIGNVVAEAPFLGDGVSLVGFENHSGRTFLGDRGGIRPLAQVVAGHGNNGKDKGEGAVYKNAIGTYLHGPVLPKNPALADWLIARALERRYGDGSLTPLADTWERKAHGSVARRFASR